MLQRAPAEGALVAMRGLVRVAVAVRWEYLPRMSQDRDKKVSLVGAATIATATVTGPGGVATTFAARDGVGRPKTVLLPGGRTLDLRYDAAGNLTQVTPPGASLHEFAFDANNRLASYAPPQVTPALATKDTQYTRDFDGLVTSTNAASLVTSTTFDALGRAGLSTGNVPRDVQYDAQGRVSSIAAGGVTLANSQFEGPLVKQVSMSGVLGAPAVLTRTYDNFFQVASWNVTAGGNSPANGVTLDYDPDGLPVAAKTPSSTDILRLTRHAQTGLVLHAQKASGGLGAVWSDATYNLYGELETFAVSRPSPQSAPYAVGYERDAAGRITKKTETVLGGTPTVVDYTYDDAGRLESETVNGVMTLPWTFDDNGNRLYGTDWKYDAQDRLTERVSGGVTTTYLYTSNGELATKTTGGASTQYTYDTAGNLKTVSIPGGPSLTYLVDGLNHRVGKKRNGVLEQVFVYDGDRIAAELDGSGNVVSRFVYLSQAHSPDLVVKNDGSSYRLVKDHLGSMRLVVNQTTGAIVQQLDYDAWGNTTVVTDGATPFQPFGFAGGLWDRDTNLVRFGARDYDASTGRWTAKDRSRFRGGLNLFAYSECDPVNLIDPRGRTPTVAGLFAGAAAGGAAGGSLAGPIGVGIGAGLGALGCALGVWCPSPDDPRPPPAPPPPPGSGGGPGAAAPPDTGPMDSGGGLCKSADKPDEDDEDDRCRKLIEEIRAECIGAAMTDPKLRDKAGWIGRCIREQAEKVGCHYSPGG